MIDLTDVAIQRSPSYIEKQKLDSFNLTADIPNQSVPIQLKTAVVHEWLSTNAGSEKVTSTIVDLFSDVDVFSTVEFLSPKDQKDIFGTKKVKTTFIQKLPFSRRHFRYYLPIFPLAVRQHALKDYPLIISSSHAFAHGVRKRKNQLHISYCHTPMRYIWDMQDIYLESNNLHKGIMGVGSKILTSILRKWDAHVSKNVDFYISNSHFTARRISSYYNKKAEVIYPPVDVDKYTPQEDKEDFYVTASRLVCYKQVEMVVEAFNRMPDKKLVVIGDGPRKEQILKMANSNIEVLSHLSFDNFHSYMRRAKGFMFAGKEDFGITLVEAQACGTPVIAFNEGGAAEIAIDGQTGVLFSEQTPESIISAVDRFEKEYNGRFPVNDIRKNAERFSREKFNVKFTQFVNECIQDKFEE